MMFLMFFGGLVFFPVSFNLVTESSTDPNRMTLNTIIFHTFILMNLFNMINCRMLDSKDHTELNLFKTILNNPIFWVVFAFECFIQHVMVTAGDYGIGKAFLQTSKLDTAMTITCWSFGVFTLIINLAIKQIPIEYFEFTEKINIETEDDSQAINKYMKIGQEKYRKSLN